MFFIDSDNIKFEKLLNYAFHNMINEMASKDFNKTADTYFWTEGVSRPATAKERWPTYINEKSNFDGDEEDANECTQASEEIKLVNLPDEPRGSQVDQREQSGDDDDRQDGVGRELEQRREYQQRDQHHY